MITYNNTTLKKLIEILEQSLYKVRFEKGTFNSGYAIVKENKMIVVNKFLHMEMKINTLLEIMDLLNIEDKLLEPKLRKYYQQLIKNNILTNNKYKTEEE